MAEKNMATMLVALTNINTAISGMAGYSPASSSIQSANLSAKATKISTLNSQIDPLENQLNNKQEERELKTNAQLETEGFDGLIRISRQVANYVKSLGSDYADEHELVRKYVNKMKPAGTRRKPKNEHDRTRSTSEQAYDSIFAHARKVLNIISVIAVYSPADTNITVASYTTLIESLETLSEDIQDILKTLKPLIRQRHREFHSKVNGVSKVVNAAKLYIKSNYGATSTEYESVKHIKA